MLKRIVGGKFFNFSEDWGLRFTPASKATNTKKKYTIGVIIDTSLTPIPTTGVNYRLHYLSLVLKTLGYRQVWFIANRNVEDVKKLRELRNIGIKIHLLPVKKFYDAAFLNLLVKKEKIDILQYEITSTFLQLGLTLKRLNGLPAVLEIHDVEAALRQTMGRKAEIGLMTMMQYAACYYADAVVAMTPVDRELLINSIGTEKSKIFLAPNGVARSFPYNGIGKSNTLIYLGNIFYPPNLEGLEFLIKHVLPLVAKRIKDVKLKVIGMAPAKVVAKYAGPGVIFTGEITDSSLFNRELATGVVGLATVLSGSGMKVKVLNYCASGLPVVATPLGYSGYERVNSLIVVKPKPQAIAQEIIRLLSNKSLAEKIGRENRGSILREYSWSKIAKVVIDAYDLAFRLGHAQTRKIELPYPLWLEEGRSQGKTLDGHFVITPKKIYGAASK